MGLNKGSQVVIEIVFSVGGTTQASDKLVEIGSKGGRLTNVEEEDSLGALCMEDIVAVAFFLAGKDFSSKITCLDR